MSPLERLLWALAPVPRRSMSLMLGAVLVFGIAGVVATLIDFPRFIDALLAMIMLAAWLVGVCGMVGYIRWYFSPSTYRQNGDGPIPPKK